MPLEQISGTIWWNKESVKESTVDSNKSSETFEIISIVTEFQSPILIGRCF